MQRSAFVAISAELRRAIMIGKEIAIFVVVQWRRGRKHAVVRLKARQGGPCRQGALQLSCGASLACHDLNLTRRRRVEVGPRAEDRSISVVATVGVISHVAHQKSRHFFTPRVLCALVLAVLVL